MITPFPKLLTEDETAEWLGVKPETLAIWRCTKRYPLAYVKVGRAVRYRESDVIAFLEGREHSGIAAGDSEAMG